jgi:hypothetical protein
VPSTRNINSELLTTVATSTLITDRRGERNVPKRYLKEAEWYPNGYLGEGYYTSDPDSDTGGLSAVDFNFETLQWGITEQIGGQYQITRPAHIKYGLRIFDEERTDRSRWGPIDGINDEEEEPLATTFRFGSEGGDTPDPDTVIPTSEIEQHAIAALAQLIPTHITRPTIPSISGLPSLASRMSQIASTTTITPTSVLARTLGAGIPAGGTQSANTIRNTLGGGGRLGGRPPGGTGPPLGPPGGGPDENPDAGGGGDPGNPGGGGDPGQPPNNPEDRLTDKLIGREPEIFDGDRTKVEGFMTEWNVYRALNDRTRVMATPLERTMLFLTFICGPNVGNWVNDQIRVVSRHLSSGGRKTDEFIWDTVIHDFATLFQDIMSAERAEAALNQLKMQGGKLDFYTAEYKRLARLADYNLDERLVGKKYFEGLPEGLRRAIVKDENMNLLTTVADYEDAAIRYHRKFLQYQAFFERPSKNPKKPTQQQWQQRFAKDNNAMDTTPGHIRARAALSDDEVAQLRKEGKCFKCRRQGHIGRNCPNQNSQIRATDTNKTSDTSQNATNTSTASSGVPNEPSIRKINAQELVELVRGMDQGEKDKVIQDIFMNEDFA